MPGADDLVILDFAAGEPAAVVRADVVDREVLAVDVVDGDEDTVDFCRGVVTGRDVGGGRDADPG